ncbi:MAG: universal stress protein [Taibaiella sp.]|nr:universal stress protein [Taibaiella sp.]
MRKTVLIFNAQSYRPGAVKFAKDVAGDQQSSLSALFINDTTALALTPEQRTVGGQTYVEEIVMSADEKKRIDAAIEASLAAFKKECIDYRLQCEPQVVSGNPMDIIRQRSRFTDMMIASPLLSFNADTHVPTTFITDLLPDVECPVLLCPEEYLSISEITLAYDGSKSAMYAIKHFFYLNPGYKGTRVRVLRIEEDGLPKHAATDNLLRDWMAVHCPSYSFVVMSGNASDVLLRYFLDNVDNDKLLVTGAFGRSAVSRFFRRSTADLVLKAADIPVFVAHT